MNSNSLHTNDIHTSKFAIDESNERRQKKKKKQYCNKRSEDNDDDETRNQGTCVKKLLRNAIRNWYNAGWLSWVLYCTNGLYIVVLLFSLYCRVCCWIFWLQASLHLILFRFYSVSSDELNWIFFVFFCLCKIIHSIIIITPISVSMNLFSSFDFI